MLHINITQVQVNTRIILTTTLTFIETAFNNIDNLNKQGYEDVNDFAILKNSILNYNHILTRTLEMVHLETLEEETLLRVKKVKVLVDSLIKESYL